MKNFEKMNVREMMETNGGISAASIAKTIIKWMPITGPILPPVYGLPVVRPVYVEK